LITMEAAGVADTGRLLRPAVSPRKQLNVDEALEGASPSLATSALR
jgi:hypothetical protein